LGDRAAPTSSGAAPPGTLGEEAFVTTDHGDIVEPLNLVMERKMLLGLEARAEAAAHVEAASQPDRAAL
jgi:hypothetical protein